MTESKLTETSSLRSDINSISIFGSGAISSSFLQEKANNKSRTENEIVFKKLIN